MPQLELVRAKAQMVKSMEEYYNLSVPISSSVDVI